MAITVNTSDSISIVTMEHGKGNAMNLDFIDSFNKALDDAEKENPRSLILTGHGKIFSAGLNLIEAYEYDPSTMQKFVEGFDDLFERFFKFPAPTVIATNGHAIAGGCILCMCGDYRLMNHEATIGLNEVLVGIPFPGAALEIARNALQPKNWPEWMYQGKRFSAQEAFADGVIHFKNSDGNILEKATAKAKELIQAPLPAVKEVKALLKQPIVDRIKATAEVSRKRFIEHWFSKEGRESMGRIRDDLLKKKSG